MLNDKGFKSRALVGGWAAWLQSGGETEPADAGTEQEKHVVASPNPRAGGKGMDKIEGEAKVQELQPTEAVKASPLKSKKKKTRTAKPRP